MKILTKLILISGLLMVYSAMSAQVPPPSGHDGDYCACVPGIQDINYNCPPCPPPPIDNGDDNNNGNGNNNGGTTGSGPGNPSGTGGTGGATGSFPNVIAWLECFYDPDCDP